MKQDFRNLGTYLYVGPRQIKVLNNLSVLDWNYDRHKASLWLILNPYSDISTTNVVFKYMG